MIIGAVGLCGVDEVSVRHAARQVAPQIIQKSLRKMIFKNEKNATFVIFLHFASSLAGRGSMTSGRTSGQAHIRRGVVGAPGQAHLGLEKVGCRGQAGAPTGPRGWLEVLPVQFWYSRPPRGTTFKHPNGWTVGEAPKGYDHLNVNVELTASATRDATQIRQCGAISLG